MHPFKPPLQSILNLYSRHKTILPSFPQEYIYQKLEAPSDIRKLLLSSFKNPKSESDGTIGAQTSQVKDESIRKVKICHLDFKDYLTLSNYFNERVSAFTKDYFALEATPCGSYSFLKYESPGSHYDFHCDAGHAFDFNGEVKFQYDYPCRNVTLVYYVNDDFEGGELELAPTYLENSFLLTPKEDHILLFPSDIRYPHKVHPMRSGTRYAVVNWFSLQGYTDSTAARYVL